VLVGTEGSVAMGVAPAGAWEAGGVVSVGTVAVLMGTENSAEMGVASALAGEAGGVVSVGAVAVPVTTNDSAAKLMSRAENCTTLSIASWR
jgi:hypothetical protein